MVRRECNKKMSENTLFKTPKKGSSPPKFKLLSVAFTLFY